MLNNSPQYQVICLVCDDEVGWFEFAENHGHGVIDNFYCHKCLFMMYELHTYLGLSIEDAQKWYPYFTCREYLGSNNRKYDKAIIQEFIDKTPELSNYAKQSGEPNLERALDHFLSQQ